MLFLFVLLGLRCIRTHIRLPHLATTGNAISMLHSLALGCQPLPRAVGCLPPERQCGPAAGCQPRRHFLLVPQLWVVNPGVWRLQPPQLFRWWVASHKRKPSLLPCKLANPCPRNGDIAGLWLKTQKIELSNLPVKLTMRAPAEVFQVDNVQCLQRIHWPWDGYILRDWR